MENEKSGMHRNASSQIFINAIELRKNPTNAERKVWESFLIKRPLGYKFRFQHPFHIFILDFYCHKLKMDIEIDGSIHDDTFQNMYDKERDTFLIEEGLEVLRIKNEEIYYDFDNVVKFILERIKNRAKEIL